MEHGGNAICGMSFLSTSDIFSFQSFTQFRAYLKTCLKSLQSRAKTGFSDKVLDRFNENAPHFTKTTFGRDTASTPLIGEMCSPGGPGSDYLVMLFP
jgi:hypothetical protein